MKGIKENIDLINLLKKFNIKRINFVRGLGIVEDRFELFFEKDNEEIIIEIETNFRIRNQEEVLLSFNDLFLDHNRKEMSVKKYRSQVNIEKSYLHMQLELVNSILVNARLKSVTLKPYGDLYIYLSKKGIVLEILNDTHLEGACLYRIIYKKDKRNYAYECCIQNNSLVFNNLKFNNSLYN